jgi:hypothetical protein
MLLEGCPAFLRPKEILLYLDRPKRVMLAVLQVNRDKRILFPQVNLEENLSTGLLIGKIQHAGQGVEPVEVWLCHQDEPAGISPGTPATTHFLDHV